MNPPIKLLDFFASKYDGEVFPANARTFQTKIACKFSPSLENAPALDKDFVAKFIERFLISAWKTSPPIGLVDKIEKKQAIVLAGPCGSGKTTIAKFLAHKLNAAFVEADELHTFEAVSRMTSGSTLTDSDRIPWLDRIKERVFYTLRELGYAKAIIACSALRKSYRHQLRQLKRKGIEVLFVDLQCEKQELVRRLIERKQHYMSIELLDSQIVDHEELGVEDIDCLPIDTGVKIELVVSKIGELLNVYAETGV